MSWNLDATPKSLLTVSGNPKLDKNRKTGHWTAVMHLSPHKGSGTSNVCAYASAGCILSCLSFAGHGGIGLDADRINSVQAARIQRTRMLKRDKQAFMAMLRKEIDAHIRRCERKGAVPSLRLNGTSDLSWEKMGIVDEYPDVQFYDYTKWDIRKRDLSKKNYSLTFSLSDSDVSDELAEVALEAGINVAAVFDWKKGVPFPATYTFRGKEYPLVDGDEDDLRFLDKVQGGFVGLRLKGNNALKKAGIDSGFVREVLPA